ncbi:MAG: hypothetical protein AAFN78_16755 [Pseudomonadota bacterium]
MTDAKRTEAQLLDALESLSLVPGEFHHEDHLRAAWQLLRTVSFEDAVARFAAALRRLTEHFGAPEKYHETITLFYLHLVNARMQALPAQHEWRQFLEQNPDLFESHPALIGRYYSKPRLGSAAARRHFVLPDKMPHDFIVRAVQ